MAKQESFTCDVCGAVKGEGNRWLMGSVSTVCDRPGYTLLDWNPQAESWLDVHHLCSEKCAFTKLGEHIRKDAPIGANVDVTA